MILKDIPGYEGLYAADADGSIYRIEWYGKAACRKLAQYPKRGYLTVVLHREKKRIYPGAHRCVWQAFNGPIPAGLEINHKNGKRDDNRLENLEVVTKSENALHKFHVNGYRSHGRSLRGAANHAAKLTEDAVREIRRLYATGAFTQKGLGGRFGVSQPMIGMIVRREKWEQVD